MGGGNGGVTYKGITIHQHKRWNTVTGKGLCAVMWFWVLYRAKQDGHVVLGWRHPWEGHGHGDHYCWIPYKYSESKGGREQGFIILPNLCSYRNHLSPN